MPRKRLDLRQANVRLRNHGDLGRRSKAHASRKRITTRPIVPKRRNSGPCRLAQVVQANVADVHPVHRDVARLRSGGCRSNAQNDKTASSSTKRRRVDKNEDLPQPREVTNKFHLFTSLVEVTMISLACTTNNAHTFALLAQDHGSWQPIASV